MPKEPKGKSKEILDANGSLAQATGASFAGIDNRFDKVDARFNHVDSRLDNVEASMRQMDTRLGNVSIEWTKSMND
jgi:hypothetical protein